MSAAATLKLSLVERLNR